VSRPGESGGTPRIGRLFSIGRSSKYNEELRERAVRMVAEIRPDYGSQWAAICAVAGKLGIGAPETVRTWVRRAEVDAGSRPGMTTEQAADVARLKRENAELRRANEILKAAAIFFGAELCATRRREYRGRVRDPVGLVVAAAE
jgi:transposase